MAFENIREDLEQILTDTGRAGMENLGKWFLGEATETEAFDAALAQYKKETIANMRRQAEQISLYVLAVGVGIMAVWLIFK